MKKLLLIITLLLLVGCSKSIEFGGQSMHPTISRGDTVSYSKNIKEITRGSIVLFNTGITPPTTIKRIIGIGGDSIKIQNGKVYLKIKGEDRYTIIDEEYILESNPNYKMTFVGKTPSNEEVIYDVPDAHYFLLGDNRAASVDSRTCFLSCNGGRNQYISKSEIIGFINQ